MKGDLMKVINRFPVLETERLILREIGTNDNEALFDIFSSETIMKYYGMFPYEEMSQAEQLISNFAKAFDEEKSIRWGIELKGENILVGTCGFHNWNKKHQRAELGYELHDNHWKKGYVSEAISEVIKYGFHNLELNRIEALVYPDNIASHNSLEKLGFDKEGLLKEYCIFRNIKQDLIMYSLISNE